jgi:hypothetical protein
MLGLSLQSREGRDHDGLMYYKSKKMGVMQQGIARYSAEIITTKTDMWLA